MSIEIFIENLRTTKTGSIDGDIWIRIGEVDFPDKNWFDYPLAFLSYFSTVVLQLYHQKINDASISFMDGPYEVEIGRFNDINKTWNIKFIEEREIRKIVYEATVENYLFLSQVIKVSEKTMSILESMKVENADSKKIKKNLSTLKKVRDL